MIRNELNQLAINLQAIDLLKISLNKGEGCVEFYL